MLEGAGKTFVEVVQAIVGLVGVKYMVVHCGQSTRKVMYDFGGFVERSSIGKDYLEHRDIHGVDIEAESVE